MMLLLILLSAALLVAGYMVMPLLSQRGLASAVGVFMLVGSGALYYHYGDADGYQQWLQYTAEQQALAKAKRAFDNPQQVIEKLSAYMKAHPNDARGWYLLGRLMFVNQNYAGALTDFSKALALDDNNPDIIFNIIQTLYRQHHRQRTPEIDRLLTRLQVRYPRYIPAYLLLAMDLSEHGDSAGAQRYGQLALAQLRPASAEYAQVSTFISNLPRAAPAA
jgi:cytochrome c-type biogenesis protein CcmH